MRVRQSGPSRASTGFERTRNARPSALLQRNGLCRFGGNLLTHLRAPDCFRTASNRGPWRLCEGRQIERSHNVAGVRGGRCHGGADRAAQPQAGYCSAALRPDGDRAAVRGRGEGVGTKGVPIRFRRPETPSRRLITPKESPVSRTIGMVALAARSNLGGSGFGGGTNKDSSMKSRLILALLSGPASTTAVLCPASGRRPVRAPSASFPDWPGRNGWWCRGRRRVSSWPRCFREPV